MACGATARVRMYDFASLFKAFKFSLTLRNERRALVCMVVVVPGILKFDDLNLTI